MQRLSMDNDTLVQARRNLLRLGLIAYRKPLYQVLALEAPIPEGGRCASLSDGPLFSRRDIAANHGRRPMIDYELFCKIKMLNRQDGLTASQIANKLAILEL